MRQMTRLRGLLITRKKNHTLGFLLFGLICSLSSSVVSSSSSQQIPELFSKQINGRLQPESTSVSYSVSSTGQELYTNNQEHANTSQVSSANHQNHHASIQAKALPPQNLPSWIPLDRQQKFHELRPIQQASGPPTKPKVTFGQQVVHPASGNNSSGKILDSTNPQHKYLRSQDQWNAFHHYTTQQAFLNNQNQHQVTKKLQTIPSFGQNGYQAGAPIDDLQPRSQNGGLQAPKVDAVTMISLSDQQKSSAKCQPRGLGSILKSAKNLLTNQFASIERRSTTGSIVLGSGLLAAAIPLVALVLPENGNPATSNQRGIVGLLGQLVGQGANLQGRVESMMGWVERSIEHLPNFPRLHPQECVKRSICEAHYEPKKYGAIGFMLRLMFPASNMSSTDRMDNMDYKVINKYRHAASFGYSRRLDGENGTDSNNSIGLCKDKYEDCLVSLLDVAQNLVDLFLK